MSDNTQQADFISGLIAQLSAHKQALNEYITANLGMKAQLNLNEMKIQELNSKIETMQKEIDSHKNSESEKPSKSKKAA